MDEDDAGDLEINIDAVSLPENLDLVLIDDQSEGSSVFEARIDALLVRKANGEELYAVEVLDYRRGSAGNPDVVADPAEALGALDSCYFDSSLGAYEDDVGVLPLGGGWLLLRLPQALEEGDTVVAFFGASCCRCMMPDWPPTTMYLGRSSEPASWWLSLDRAANLGKPEHVCHIEAALLYEIESDMVEHFLNKEP